MAATQEGGRRSPFEDTPANPKSDLGTLSEPTPIEQITARRTFIEKLTSQRRKLGHGFNITSKTMPNEERAGILNASVAQSLMKFEGEREELDAEVAGYEQAPRILEDLRANSKRLAIIASNFATGDSSLKSLSSASREIKDQVLNIQDDRALMRGIERRRQEAEQKLTQEGHPSPSKVFHTSHLLPIVHQKIHLGIYHK